MIHRQMNRAVALLLLVTFGAWSGCAGRGKFLDKAELADPEPADTYLVTLVNGESLTFISLYLEDDWLIGTIRLTQSVTEGEGENATTSITNSYEEVRVPYDEVASVEAEGVKKSDGGMWLIGAAILGGAVAFLLLTGSDEEPPPDGSVGKGP